MKPPLLPVDHQVIVITGASSGIGLVTARMAADRGARVVLAARGEKALRAAVDGINEGGGEATYVVADVGRREDVHRIAQHAISTYGGFDTWVNNAGVSIFGMVDEVPIADMHRMFDTNYWGVVYGSREAVEHYKGRTGSAGAIINTGSVFGDRANPVQSTYASAKHAVHGWTDALRMEMEKKKVPVSVTLLHPGRIDTPYNEHAQSYIAQQPAHRGMIYPPEAVGEAILHAASHRTRDLFIGAQVKIAVVAAAISPRLMDKAMEAYLFWSQRSSRPSRPPGDSALYQPGYGGQERGTHEGWVRSRSYYLKAERHPRLVGALVVSCLGFLAWRRRARTRTAVTAR